MAKTIDYYFSPVSPWSYLGHARFQEIVRKHGAAIAVKPIDYGRIFPLSGGLPVAKRPPQRQAYRLVELERWRKHLGVPMNVQPRFFPYDAKLAALVIIATGDVDNAMKLAGSFMRGCWAEQKNMADEAEVIAAIRGAGLDSSALLKQANTPETAAQLESFTDEAIARQVFGAPTYVYKEELFWGQDRLEFLDRALAGA
ncbi:MAG TPA: 2-hydroxychromene-2-carboxylate isomerase [Burkholderiales bacterium]|nr:2-hydroxychromene-2-carboxylate isomerase [Burkholderiales bacterium]